MASGAPLRGADASLIQAGARLRAEPAKDPQKELAEKLARKKELEDSIAKVTEENKNILAQVDEITKSFSSASEAAAKDPKEREKHQLRNSVSQLKNDLKNVMAEIVTLQNQVKLFGDEYTKVQGEFREINSQITDLTLDNSAQNRSTARLEDVLKERAKQVEAIRAEQRVADNELRNVTEANALVENSLQKTIASINARASEIESQVEKLKAHLEELRQQVDSMMSDITVLQQKLDAETERSRDLAGQYDRAVEAREAVQESLEEHRRKFAEAQAGLSNAEASLNHLRNETVTLREEVKHLTEEYRHLTELRANSTDAMDRLEANTDHLSVLVDEANGAIEMLHERVDKMTEAIEAERKDHEETEKGIDVATKSIRRTLKFLHSEADRREAAHERAKQTTAARFDLVRTVARLAIKVGPHGASGPDRMCPCALITVEEAEEAGLEEGEVKALSECQHECERRRFCGVQCKRNRAAREAAEKKKEAAAAAAAAAAEAEAEAAHPDEEHHHHHEDVAAPLAALAAEAQEETMMHTEEDAARLAHATEDAEVRRQAAEAAARHHQQAAEALEHAAKALASLSEAAGTGNLEEVSAVARQQINAALGEAADAIEKAGEAASKTIKPGKDGSESIRHHTAVSHQLVQAAAGIGKVAQAIVEGSDVASLADAEREVVSALQRAADILDAAGSEAVSMAASEEANAGADEEGEVETTAEKQFSDSAAKAFAEAAKILDKAVNDAEHSDVTAKAEELKNEHKSFADKIRNVASLVSVAVDKARLTKQHEAEQAADTAEASRSIEASTSQGIDAVEKQKEEAIAKLEAQMELAKSKEEVRKQIEEQAEETKKRLLEEAERKKKEAEEEILRAHAEELERQIKAIPSPAPSVAPAPANDLNMTKEELSKFIADAVAQAQPSPEPEVGLDEKTSKAVHDAEEVVKEANKDLEAGMTNVTVKEAAVHGAEVEPAGEASEAAAQASADADAAVAAVEKSAEKVVALNAGQNATVTETTPGGDVEQTNVEVEAANPEGTEVAAALLQAHASTTKLLARLGALLGMSERELKEASGVGPLHHVRYRTKRADPATGQETLAPQDQAVAVPADNATVMTEEAAAAAPVAATNATTEEAAAAAPVAATNATTEEAAAGSTVADEATAATGAVSNATSGMFDAISSALSGGSSNATTEAAPEAAAVEAAVANATATAEVAAVEANATALLQEGAGRHHHHRHHHHRRHHLRMRGIAHAAPAAAPATAGHTATIMSILEGRPARTGHHARQDQNTLAPTDDAAATATATAAATNATAEPATNATTAAAAPAEETSASQNSTIDGAQIGRDIAVIAGLAESSAPATTTTTPEATNATTNATTAPAAAPAAANATFANDAEAAKSAVGADGDGQTPEAAVVAFRQQAAAVRFMERMAEQERHLSDAAAEATALLQVLSGRHGMDSSNTLAASGDDLSPEDRAAIAKAELTGVISTLAKLETELADAKKLTADYNKELQAKQAKKAEFDALAGEDVDSLRSTQSTLDKAYNAQVSIKTDLTTSRDTTRSDLETAQAKKRDAESRAESFRSAIERFKKRQESIQLQIDRLKEEKASISANIEAARERAGNEKSAGLERKLELMKAEAKAKERTDESTAVRAKLTEAVHEQQGKYDALKHQVEGLEHSIEGAKENQTRIAAKIAEEVDRTSQLSEADSVARSKAEHAKELTDEAEQEEVETRAAMEDLQAIKQQMLEPQARLKADLARLKTSIEENTVKRDELLKTAQTLDHELNEVRSHAGSLNATLVTLRDANSHLHEELRKRNTTAKHLSELVELNRHEAELANRVVADSKARIEMLETDLLRLQKMDQETADGLRADHGSLVLPVEHMTEEEQAAAGNGMDQPGDEVSAADVASDAAEKKAQLESEEAQLEAEASGAEGADAEAVHREVGEKQADAEMEAIEKAAEAAVHEEGLDEGVTASAKSAVESEEAAAMSSEEHNASTEQEAASAGAEADGAGEVASGLGEAIKEAEG
jgi:trimeric autotransporter adhesin